MLFPGEEDFGIVPLEAQACGTPVIALAQGGATESVLPLGGTQSPTGVWFAEQSVEALVAAITQFEQQAGEFDPEAARRQALRFRQERFAEELLAFLEGVLRGAGKELPLAA